MRLPVRVFYTLNPDNASEVIRLMLNAKFDFIGHNQTKYGHIAIEYNVRWRKRRKH
jgi:hypothetical protein